MNVILCKAVPAGAVLGSCLLLAGALIVPGRVAAEDAKPAPPVVLQDIALGAITMTKPMMRARTYTMAPGFKTPPHQHDGPGIRYVLEGQITIYWKDGRKETYGPGQAFFEGPGENHPVHEMSAANEGDTPVKVFVVDLHPGQ